MTLEITIFNEAFRGTEYSMDRMRTKDLPAASNKYGNDPGKNFALRPLLTSLDPKDATKHCPDLHIMLAQSYLEIGLIHEGTRSAILATSQYLIEGGRATTYAERAGQLLLGAKFDWRRIQDIFEEPTRAYEKAFYEQSTNGDIPRRYFVSKHGQPLDAIEQRKVQKALDMENRVRAYQYAGLHFAPREFTNEQEHWIEIVLKEAKDLLKKLGIQRARETQTSDLVCVNNKDFRTIVRGGGEIGTISSDAINDAYIEIDTVYLDQNQKLPDFIHSLCHEVFGHLSATKIVEYDRRQNGIYRKQTGLRVQNQTKTGFDMRFEWLDEIMTEILGYMLRLELLRKYSGEIAKEMGNEGVAKLHTAFVTSHTTHIGIAVLRAIQDREKISSIDAIKIMCETYYKGKSDFFGKMKAAIGDKKFEYIVNLQGDLNSLKAIKDICGENIVASMLRNQPTFANNDPLSEPLFRDVMTFLQK